MIEELDRIIEAGNNMIVSVDGSFFPEEYDYSVALMMEDYYNLWAKKEKH